MFLQPPKEQNDPSANLEGADQHTTAAADLDKRLSKLATRDLQIQDEEILLMG